MKSTATDAKHDTRDAASRNLTSISPFFIVKDLRASLDYYIDRLGFQLDFQGPDDDVYYGHVSRDGIGVMLKTISPDVLPRPNHTLTNGRVGTPTSILKIRIYCSRSSRSAAQRS